MVSVLVKNIISFHPNSTRAEASDDDAIKAFLQSTLIPDCIAQSWYTLAP